MLKTNLRETRLSAVRIISNINQNIDVMFF